MADRPGLGTLLDAHSDQATAKMRGPMPGKVLSYDRVTQCAEVQPLVSPKGQTLPVLPRVPVLFPRGLMGGYSIVWDLHEMDEVLLIPCEMDISAWQSRGISGEAPTKRRFDAADCIAVPGIGSLVSALSSNNYLAGALVITGSDIRLASSSASDFVALASKVLTELQAIKNAYDTHLHDASTVIAPPGGGPCTGLTGVPSSAPAVPAPMPAPTSPASTTTRSL